MHLDIRSYYKSLELSRTASADEVKSAYRQKAKHYHPDSGGDRDGSNIRIINEAYSVLGDPGRRAAYDRACEQTGPERPRTRISPIRCHVCEKVTAQPRHLTFWRVFSLLVATNRTPIQGIFCAPCASRESFRSTALTASLGWWGVPWGPIWTIVEGLKNAFGGARDRARDELLMWHNAVAFTMAGQTALGYGLAERLLSSPDPKVRADAAALVTQLRDKGFEPSGHLSDAWRRSRIATLFRVAMILALPIGAFSLASTIDWSNPPSGQGPEQVALYSAPPDNSAAQSAMAEAIAVEAAPVPTCASVPSNGDVLAGSKRLLRKGHLLTIQNGSGGDAIVKVRKAATGKVFATYFIANNDQADLAGLPDGDYRIQYAFGEQLGADCKSFVGVKGAGEFPDIERMVTSEQPDLMGTMIRRAHVTYTLYSTPSGTVRPTNIDAEQFNAA